jgi:hypothetical protein
VVAAPRAGVRQALEQKLDAAAIYPVTLHHQTDQRILDQLGKRAFCELVAHNPSLNFPTRH